MEHWLELRTGEHLSRAETGDNAVSNLFEDGYDADVALEPGSPSAMHRRALMAAVLGRIKETADKAGIPVLLLVIPSPFDVVVHYDPKPDAMRHPDYRPEGLCDLVTTMAARSTLPCLNLFQPFQRNNAEGLYFQPGNDHWNDAGQALAAEICAQSIGKLGLLH